MLRILDLTHFARFQDSRYVKVLRHRDTTHDLWHLQKRGLAFQRYQNNQGSDVFGQARAVISFIAERHKYARFVGVWEVLAKRPKENGYRYTTRKLEGFEDLVDRLVVRWGDGTRSWAQWLHRKGNKEISEILPCNYVTDFPGFYDFTLAYSQLRTLVENPDSNREWHRMLSSLSGVYVILDTSSGNQYIGSAYGAGGIWSRWKAYTRNPSGGNKLIEQLLKRHPHRYESFQFSILRMLEPGSTKEQVIAQEKIAKRKLGTRAFGLNDN